MDIGSDKQKYFVLNGILFSNILRYKGLILWWWKAHYQNCPYFAMPIYFRVYLNFRLIHAFKGFGI